MSFSLVMNGAKSSFKPARGLHQGDPISPYLFLLVSDVLACMLKRAQANNSIQGYKINRYCPTLTHLLFADDTVLFGKASIQEAKFLKLIIEEYNHALRQCVNRQKSDIIFSRNTLARVQHEVAEILNIQNSGLLSKYLGLPIEWGRSKSRALNFLKEKIKKKIYGWQNHFLSMAGREVLIKVVVQAIPSFVISSFKLPKGFIYEIYKMIAKFWWKQAVDKGGIHWRR